MKKINFMFMVPLFVLSLTLFGCKIDPVVPQQQQYDILVNDDIIGGRVAAVPLKAKAGETISLTAYPDPDAEFDQFIVTNLSTGQPIPVSMGLEPGTLEGTFHMPASNVSVSAEFSLEIGPSIFSINVVQTEGGTVEADKETAKEHETVNITADPLEGYNFAGFLVYRTGSQNITVALNAGEGTERSFYMPRFAVTVNAVFEFEETPRENPVIIDTFTDSEGFSSGPANWSGMMSRNGVPAVQLSSPATSDSFISRTVTQDLAGTNMLTVRVDVTNGDSQFPPYTHRISLETGSGPENSYGVTFITTEDNLDRWTNFTFGFVELLNNSGESFASRASKQITAWRLENIERPGVNYWMSVLRAEPERANFKTIQVPQLQNGSIDVVQRATPLRNVFITATPAANYILQGPPEVTGPDGPVPVKGFGYEWFFVMPGGDASVSANFVLPEPNAVNLIQTSGGSIASNVSQASGDDIVTITATPNSGFYFDSINIVRDDTDEVVPVSGTANTRTFTMPASSVTVTSVFEEISSSMIIDGFDYYTEGITRPFPNASFGFVFGDAGWHGLLLANHPMAAGLPAGRGHGFAQSTSLNETPSSVQRTNLAYPSFINNVTQYKDSHPFVSLWVFTRGDPDESPSPGMVNFELRTGNHSDANSQHIVWAAPPFSIERTIVTPNNPLYRDSGWVNIILPLSDFKNPAGSPISGLTDIAITGWKVEALGMMTMWVSTIELVQTN